MNANDPIEDSSRGNYTRLGGARVMIATAPASKAMIELIGVLGPNRRLGLIGVSSDPIELAPPQLIKQQDY